MKSLLLFALLMVGALLAEVQSEKSIIPPTKQFGPVNKPSDFDLSSGIITKMASKSKDIAPQPSDTSPKIQTMVPSQQELLTSTQDKTIILDRPSDKETSHRKDELIMSQKLETPRVPEKKQTSSTEDEHQNEEQLVFQETSSSKTTSQTSQKSQKAQSHENKRISSVEGDKKNQGPILHINNTIIKNESKSKLTNLEKKLPSNELKADLGNKQTESIEKKRSSSAEYEQKTGLGKNESIKPFSKDEIKKKFLASLAKSESKVWNKEDKESSNQKRTSYDEESKIENELNLRSSENVLSSSDKGEQDIKLQYEESPQSLKHDFNEIVKNSEKRTSSPEGSSNTPPNQEPQSRDNQRVSSSLGNDNPTRNDSPLNITAVPKKILDHKGRSSIHNEPNVKRNPPTEDSSISSDQDDTSKPAPNVTDDLILSSHTKQLGIFKENSGDKEDVRIMYTAENHSKSESSPQDSNSSETALNKTALPKKILSDKGSSSTHNEPNVKRNPPTEDSKLSSDQGDTSTPNVTDTDDLVLLPSHTKHLGIFKEDSGDKEDVRIMYTAENHPQSGPSSHDFNSSKTESDKLPDSVCSLKDNPSLFIVTRGKKSSESVLTCPATTAQQSCPEGASSLDEDPRRDFSKSPPH